MSEAKQNDITRRDFLINAGTFTAGAIVTGGVLSTVGSRTAEAAAPGLPWAYASLDPATVMQAAYNNYALGGCCYAVGKALVDALVVKVGTPWDAIPTDIFKFGKGGIVSWGTLCGALNSALAVIGMVAGTSASTISNELLGWYTGYNFPSTRMDAYAVFKNQQQTISNSPLCHQSSSNWSYTTGYKINSAERKDRCAKVSGDVAYQTVEYLNAWKSGTFTPIFQHDPSYARCFTCHVGVDSKYDNVQGKINCLKCHDDKTTHKL